MPVVYRLQLAVVRMSAKLRTEVALPVIQDADNLGPICLQVNERALVGSLIVELRCSNMVHIHITYKAVKGNARSACFHHVINSGRPVADGGGGWGE